MTQSSNSGRQLRLPDFIAVGPGRTGTTWLHEILKGRVNLPAGIKETEFFTTNYYKGIDWYAHHFRNADSVRPVGEVNPYFGFPESAERVALHIPRCKIICTFRNPVERIYSEYKLWRHYTLTRFPLDKFLVKVPQVIESTRYAKHLPDWLARFGQDRVLVLLNEDLRADPQAYLDRVCDFIGIERYPVPASAGQGELINSINDLPRFWRVARKARHLMYWLREKQAYRTSNFLERAGAWKLVFGGGSRFPPLDPASESHLYELMRPEIDGLERMTGRDLSAWKAARADRRRVRD
ncbi:sulfotransferase domain-containing protein [Candidatus Binatus soli]|uniref:sulfotransferase domain-containing protein n=1 Tax=Candidatus Binatus soli TaxID=1953413 RepID=UPI003D114F2D